MKNNKEIDVMSMPEHRRLEYLLDLSLSSGRNEPHRMIMADEIYRQKQSYKITMDGFIPARQTMCNLEMFLAFNEQRHRGTIGETYKSIFNYYKDKCDNTCSVCGYKDVVLHEKWIFEERQNIDKLGNHLCNKKFKYNEIEELSETFESAKKINIQVFTGFDALCESCHSIKHPDRLDPTKLNVAKEMYGLFNELDTSQIEKDYRFFLDSQSAFNNCNYYIWFANLPFKKFDEHLRSRLFQFQFYLPFDCHSYEFQKFLKEQQSEGIKDNG